MLALSDDDLLAAVPAYIQVGGLLKASPAEEGGERILYFEASNESVDYQNEIVLQKALAASADYYLRHGNIDLSHITIMGPKAGIPNYMEYEIGKPLHVEVSGRRTFVKAQLYAGDSPMARNANMVWDSITKQSPPSRWYPSVGGAVLAKSIKIDPATKSRIAVVESVRWNNVALDRCPVNLTVPEVSTMAVGTFAKALGGFVLKGLEAGYGTDVSALAGGGALRTQSLDTGVSSYWDLRDRLAKDIRSGTINSPTASRLVDHCVNSYGLAQSDAAEWVERFMADLKAGLKKRASR